MLKMLLSRLATAIPSIVGVVIVTFMLTRLLPGDPAAYFAGLAAIAIPLGVLAAVKQGTWIDHLCRIVTTAGVSLPVFFTGLLFAYVFYYLLQIAPAPTGRLDVFLSPPPDITGFYLIDSLLTGNLETFWGALRQLALPGISM